MAAHITATLTHADGEALLQLLPGGEARQQTVTAEYPECLCCLRLAHLYHLLIQRMGTDHAVHIVGHSALVVGEHHAGKGLIITQQFQRH